MMVEGFGRKCRRKGRERRCERDGFVGDRGFGKGEEEAMGGRERGTEGERARVVSVVFFFFLFFVGERCVNISEGNKRK